MPLDPSIPLQVKAPTFETPDFAKTIANAATIKKAQLEQAKAEVEDQFQMLSSATPENYGQIRNMAIQKYGDDAATRLPESYDPAAIKQLGMSLLTAKDRVDLENKKLEYQLNQDKFSEEKRHNSASEDIAKTRVNNAAGAFGSTVGDTGAGVDTNNPASMPAASPNVTTNPATGGIPAAPVAIGSPAQLPAGTLQPPVATNAPTGTPSGSPSGTATLAAPSFAPNPSAKPGATGVPPGVTPVITASGSAAPSFYQRNPQVQAALQAVADYKTTPEEAFSNRNDRSRAMGALLTDFPPDKDGNGGYDKVNYAAKVATVKDYAPGGKDGQKYQSLNQLGSHLAEGDKIFSALGNSSFIPANTLINYAKQITGNASITDAGLARAAISDETGRLMRGVGMSDAESEKYAGALANSNSPAQFQGAMNTIADLVGGRLKALNFGYDQALGKPGVAAQKFVDHETKAILVKHSPGLAKDLGVSTDAHPLAQTPQAQDIKAKLQSGAITYEQAAAALKALK